MHAYSRSGRPRTRQAGRGANTHTHSVKHCWECDYQRRSIRLQRSQGLTSVSQVSSVSPWQPTPSPPRLLTQTPTPPADTTHTPTARCNSDEPLTLTLLTPHSNNPLTLTLQPPHLSEASRCACAGKLLSARPRYWLQMDSSCSTAGPRVEASPARC